MRRGTTPKIYFEIDFDPSLVEKVWLTISQRSDELFTKSEADMTIEGNRFTVELTQEETLMLDEDDRVMVQARIRTKSGEALASDIETVRVEDILKDGVI